MLGREHTLREAEERFRLALDEAPIGMALVGLDGRFLRVNRALCEIVGYSREELTALTFQQITHPEDVDIDVALAERLFGGEIPRYQLAKRYIRKDGSIADVMLHGSVVRDAAGAPLYGIAQVQDITEQKRSEEALRRSESRFRDLFEQLSDGVFVADLSGRYTDVNAAGCRMLGYAREEIVGKSIMDLIPPEDVPRLAESREQMLEPGHVHTGEWSLRRKDGAMLPVEISAKILSDGRWQAVVRDVSERRRAEAELRRSEESLARAQRVAHVGSWEWNLRTGEVWHSMELYRLFGVDPSPRYAHPLSLLDLCAPSEREWIRRVVEDAVRNGSRYCIEHRVERPDGTERFVLQQGEPVFERGQLVSMIGTVLDITERKRAELETERSLRRLDAVLSLAPTAIIVMRGENSEEITLNECAEALMGRAFSPRGGLAQYAGYVLDASGAPVPVGELPGARALRGETTEGLELQIANPARGLVPVLVNAAPIRRIDSGEPEAVVAFQDTSPLKELERLRAEWSSIIAHDLRQPVSTIALASELIRSALPADVETTHLERIARATRRLRRMIDDLLDSSRLEARQLQLTKREVDLVALARESAAQMVPQAAPRAIELVTNERALTAEVDPDRVAQVLENLLTNAVKYGAPDTPIVIELRREGRGACISVTNEGETIPPAELPFLFRRFQRSEGARTSPVKGLGLGLYISRELVEAHGGRIAAESTAGRTTFRVWLPMPAEARLGPDARPS